MHMRGAVFVTLLALLTFGVFQAPSLASHQHAAARHHARAHAQHHRRAVAKVAPADEYFGRLKMSILGIQNSLKDITARVAFNPSRAGDQMGAAVMVEDAIHDWEHKYPADSWLPKSVYLLSRLYSAIPTEEAQAKAESTLQWLIRRYPSTAYAATARSQISLHETK